MDNSGIRAFFAIPTPDHVKESVRGLTSRVSTFLPGARFVKPDRLHLTLHFFASLTAKGIESVSDAAKSAVEGRTPYTMRLGGLGVFPDERRPRVLWVDILEGADPTRRLASAIGSELTARDLPVETRPFRSHVTVARFRDPRRLRIGEALMEGRRIDFEPFTAERVVLYRSELRPAGPVYTLLDEFSLSGRV